MLLTHEDLADRTRYLNARSTLITLLKLNVVPIINENDTVAASEIRFGDNDTLGALVTNLIETDADHPHRPAKVCTPPTRANRRRRFVRRRRRATRVWKTWPAAPGSSNQARAA